MRIHCRIAVGHARLLLAILAAFLPSLALAGTATFTGLTNPYGTVGAGQTAATAISADGQYIVGVSEVAGPGTFAGTVWSPTSVGMNTNLPLLPGGLYSDLLQVLPTAVTSVSGGLFAVGTRIDYNSDDGLWAPMCESHTSQTVFARADWMTQGTGIVTSVSRTPDGDSLVVAGYYSPDPANSQGYAWKNTIYSVSSSVLAPDAKVIMPGSKALAVSGDGRYVFGIDQISGSGNVWWLGKGRPAPLYMGLTLSADNPFPRTSSRFSGVDPASGHYMGPVMATNYDGSIIVGSNAGQAVKWTSDGVTTMLPGLAGQSITHAAGVSDDGSIVVGFGSDGATSTALAWDGANKVYDLNTLLTSGGASLAGWQLEAATGISADGRSIVGYGIYNGLTQGWLANVSSVYDLFNPAPPPPPPPTGKIYDWVGNGYYYSGMTDPLNWSPSDTGPGAADCLRITPAHKLDSFLSSDVTYAGIVVTGNFFLPLNGHTLTLAPSPANGFTGALEISNGGDVNIQLGTVNVDSISVGAGYLMIYNNSTTNVTGQVKVVDPNGGAMCGLENLTAGSILVGDPNTPRTLQNGTYVYSGNLGLSGVNVVTGDVDVYGKFAVYGTLTCQNFSIHSGAALGTYQMQATNTINANLNDLSGEVDIYNDQLTINGAVAQVTPDGTLTGGTWFLINGSVTFGSVGDITSSFASIWLEGSSEFTNLRHLQNNYGTLLVANGHPAGNLCSLNNFGNFYVENNYTQWTIAGDFTNSGWMWVGSNGEPMVKDSPRLAVDGIVNNNCMLFLDNGVLAAQTVNNQGNIMGRGKIEGHVNNSALIAPDAGCVLEITNGLTQGAAGTLYYQAQASQDSMGLINVSGGHVDLGGTLKVDFNGQTFKSATLLTFSDPNPSIRFNVIKAQGISAHQAMVPFLNAGEYGVNVVDVTNPQHQADMSAPTFLHALPDGSCSPTDDGNGVCVDMVLDSILGHNAIQMRDGRTDGTASVFMSLPVTVDGQFLSVDFSYRFLTAGQLKIMLGGQIEDVIVAPYSGSGRDTYAEYNVTYDLAALGLTGTTDFELLLTNPGGDPTINIGDIQLATTPEPATLALLTMGALAMLRRRRK